MKIQKTIIDENLTAQPLPDQNNTGKIASIQPLNPRQNLTPMCGGGGGCGNRSVASRFCRDHQVSLCYYCACPKCPCTERLSAPASPMHAQP